MHPGFWGWLRRQHEQYHAAEHGEVAGQAYGEGRCHPGRRHGWGHSDHFGSGHFGGRFAGSHFGGGPFGGGHHGHGFDDHGGGFGVRRPLRFLAHKLDLNDEQVAAFAAIVDRLKTERAQADVDQRRRTAALAEAFEGASFDSVKVDAANEEQAKSNERLRACIKLSLEQMHALLDAEQRKKFAYFLRSGMLAI